MDIKERALFMAQDPEVKLDGRPVPVMTTLLYRYCGNDAEKFEKLCGLINIIQDRTIELTIAGMTNECSDG